MLRGLLLTLLLTLFISNGWTQIEHSRVKRFDTRIRLDGKKLIHTVDVEIQINTGKGTNMAEVDIYSMDKLKNLSAHIEDIFGNEIRSLKKKDIEYANAFESITFHSESQRTSFKLIHNRYPYLLKYSYSTEYIDYVQLEYWKPNEVFEGAIDEATLSITLPSDFQFRAIENQIDSSYTTQPEEGQVSYHWQLKHPEKKESEKYAPPLSDYMPGVTIIPLNFHYGIEGSTESWQSYGNWHYMLNSGLDELSTDEKLTVHRLVDEMDTPKEKIRTLYHYLQDHTRYINVSLELGGLCPHPATYVCQNKFGDCKALSNYMKALLKEAGITAYYTTIYSAYNPIRVKDDYPSQQFNHVILCVPQPKDTIWLECTSASAPFNYIGTSNQGRKALIVEKDNSRLINTPFMQPNDCNNTFTTTIDLSNGQQAHIQTEAILRGSNFEYFKGFEDYIPKSRQSDFFDYLQLMKNIDVSTVNISRPHRDSSYVLLQLEATGSNIAENIGQKLLIQPVNRLSFGFEKPDKRTLPVSISLPISRTDTVNYKTRLAHISISGIKNSELKTKYGSYTRRIESDGQTFRIVRSLIIHNGFYELEEYEAFYNFIAQINRLENQKILISQN